MVKTYYYLSVIACYIVSICKNYKLYKDGINIIELTHVLRAMVVLQHENEKIKDFLEKTGCRRYFYEDVEKNNFLDIFPSVNYFFKDQSLNYLTFDIKNEEMKMELEEIKNNEFIKEVADVVLSLPRNELLDISINKFEPNYDE